MSTLVQCTMCCMSFKSECAMKTHQGMMHKKQLNLNKFMSAVISNKDNVECISDHLSTNVEKPINLQSVPIDAKQVKQIALKKFILSYNGDICTVGSTTTLNPVQFFWLEDSLESGEIPFYYNKLSHSELTNVTIELNNDTNTDREDREWKFDEGYVIPIIGYNAIWSIITNEYEINFDAILIEDKEIVLIQSEITIVMHKPMIFVKISCGYLKHTSGERKRKGDDIFEDSVSEFKRRKL
eukprot:424891_1